MKKMKMFLLLTISSLLFAACASHHCHNRYGRYKHSEVIIKVEQMQENAWQKKTDANASVFFCLVLFYYCLSMHSSHHWMAMSLFASIISLGSFGIFMTVPLSKSFGEDIMSRFAA